MILGRTGASVYGAARRLSFAAALVAALMLPGSGARPALAAPGDLDPTFDGDGMLTTPFGSPRDPRSARAFAVAIQKDGKIVAAGNTSQNTEPSNDFALARYLPDGKLDSTFGTSGKVISPIGSDEDVATAVAIQKDDKIVAAGRSFNPNGTDYDFAVARYLPNGMPDPAFSGDGKLTTDIHSFDNDDKASAVAIQKDDKIVVAGRSNQSFALARYLPDGQLDPAFGFGGAVTTLFGAGVAGINAIAIQKDGKIVAAGGFQNAIALARYLEDGQLDSTFGTGGTVVTTLPGFSKANSIALQQDGRIVVGGLAGNEFLVALYRGFGVLDPSFGNGGIVTTTIVPNQEAAVHDVAIHSKQTILAVGRTCSQTGCAFALARYLPNGQLDQGFGNGGKVTTTFKASHARALDVAIGRGDVIVAAGSAGDDVNVSDFALARYLAK